MRTAVPAIAPPLLIDPLSRQIQVKKIRLNTETPLSQLAGQGKSRVQVLEDLVRADTHMRIDPLSP